MNRSIDALIATSLQNIHRRAWETVQQAQGAGTPPECHIWRSAANAGCVCVQWRKTYGTVYAAFAHDPDAALVAEVGAWLEVVLAARDGRDVYCQACGDNPTLTDYLPMHGFRLDSAGFELRCGGPIPDAAPHPALLPRPYAAAALDAYLALLDAAFAPLRYTNGWTLAEFTRNREQLARRWAAKSGQGDFVAFWTSEDFSTDLTEKFAQSVPSVEANLNGETLVGLYELNRDTLNTLAVHPAVQRRGYGAALLRHALHTIRERRGHPWAYLNVVENNTAALNFYQKHGFTRTGHYREYTYCP